ncbi:MAG: glycosyltransferase family 2 protein [Treponema sp.]|nr:glycosyltransferase family 2 protein [Treponema sp.]
MKIFAIMLVKDEADIVASVLKSAETWADKIFVLDNGSTDGTWEIIQSLANDKIVPWKQYFGPYHNGLRADVYNEFKHLSEPGDWWCCKLDADEIYAESPRDFLKKVPKNCQLVAKKSIDYVITKNDAKTINFYGNFEADKKFLKHIKKECWVEPRFFRYRKGLTWNNDPNNHTPPHTGVLSNLLILVYHYQFRSPQQMQKRLDIRNAAESKKQGLSFRHVKETDWHELLLSDDDVLTDEASFSFYKSLPCRNNIHQSWFKKTLMRIGIVLKIYR